MNRVVVSMIAVAGLAAAASAGTYVTYADLVPAGSASPPSSAGSEVRRSSFTTGGLTITAYADPRGFSYQTYNGIRGLGVTNPNPTAPQREINGSEFILLTFSQPVAISRLDIAQIYLENGINETAQFVVNPTLYGDGVQFTNNDPNTRVTAGIGSNLGGTASTVSATGDLTSVLGGFAVGTTVNQSTRAYSGGVNTADNTGLSSNPDSYSPGSSNPGGARSIQHASNIFGTEVYSLLLRVLPGQGFDTTQDGADFSFVQMNLTVVPLPPAAWAGIGSLACVAGFGVIRRRRMAAV